MTKSVKQLEFSAFDTLFFRESRPMESVGAKPLEGRFPPSARTMSGVVRTLVGDAMGVDWASYVNGDASQQAVRDLIGAADQDGIGQLDLRGPFPLQSQQRLYPAPLHFMSKGEGDNMQAVFLQPADAVECDLGKVYLPELPTRREAGESAEKVREGLKPSDGVWLTREGLQRVLGKQPPEKRLEIKSLFAAESRLGIALNAKQRSAEEGMLYQTIHARPTDDISLGLEVEGLPDCFQDEWHGVQRMGGEGRFAAVSCAAQATPTLAIKQPEEKAKGMVLVLLTPANFGGNWVLPHFEAQQDEQNATRWHGELAGIKLILCCAVLGKVVREGGWDLKNHQARPVHSLIPAGSVYFCEVEDDLAAAVQALQGQKVGWETELGRGEIAVGYW